MPILEGIEKYILQDKFNFKPNCIFKAFLEKYTGMGNQSFKLMDIHQLLHATIKAQDMYDDNNHSIIICTPELEHVLNVKAMHTLDLLSKILEHITRESPNNMPPKYERITPAEIDQNDFWNQHTPIHHSHNGSVQYFVQESLRKILGLAQRKYSEQEIYRELCSYIISSPSIIIDNRNATIAQIGNDPIGKIFKMQAIHSSQIEYIISNFLFANDTQILNNIEEIFIPEALQFYSHIYLTPQAAATFINSTNQNEQTNCYHFIPTIIESPSVEEFEIPSAEETIRPEQAMGRTQSLSSADNTDTEDNMTYAQKLDKLITSESEDVQESVNTHTQTHHIPIIESHDVFKSSSSDEVDYKPNSSRLILSALRNATMYGDIACEISFPDENKIYISIEVLKESCKIKLSKPRRYCSDENNIQQAKEKHPIYKLLPQQFSDINDETTINKCKENRKTLLSQIEHIIEETKKGKQNLNNENENSDKYLALEDSKYSTIQNLYIYKEMLLRWNTENNYILTKINETIMKTENSSMSQTPKPDNSQMSEPITQDQSTSKQNESLTSTKTEYQMNNTVLSSRKHKTCIDCKATLTTKLPRCKECYNIRKQWIPERPKKRKRVEPPARTISSDYENYSENDNTNQQPYKKPEIGSTTINQILSNSELEKQEICWCCCARDRNALLIHGKQGHRIVCYPCAKKIWNTRSSCPICQRKLEKIVKIINA